MGPGVFQIQIDLHLNLHCMYRVNVTANMNITDATESSSTQERHLFRDILLTWKT